MEPTKPYRDPLVTSAAALLVPEVIAHFETMGGGPAPPGQNNPVRESFAKRPPVFALGVDVGDVVRFVIVRMLQEEEKVSPPLVGVSLLDLEALRDVQSEVQNDDEVDPRVYVCTWQPQRRQDALRALAGRIERAFEEGALP